MRGAEQQGLDPVKLATAQQRRAADPGSSVWVAASAGSGKTKVLTDRVLSLLLQGSEPARLLCLTFTKAAAAEMANRLANRLSAWAVMIDRDLVMNLTQLLGEAPDEDTLARARQLFALVLDVPGGMKIQTIHSFCQSLLARFPLEAGIAPTMRVLDERERPPSCCSKPVTGCWPGAVVGQEVGPAWHSARNSRSSPPLPRSRPSRSLWKFWYTTGRASPRH